MYLMNMSNTTWDLQKFNNNWNDLSIFLDKHRLDGVELILYKDDYLDTLPYNMVKGLHLSYFATWLEFYNNDIEKLNRMYDNEDAIIEYYGGLNPEILVDTFINEYENAKNLNVEYMVYHVGHVTPEHIFSYKFDYSDEEVLDATADLVNKAFNHDSEIKLLFENLWWPGLTLLDKEKTKRFLDKIKYKNKGIMLDLSHIMITNPNLKNCNDAAEYIIKQINNLGELKEYIKGIHVNKSLPGDYMSQNHMLLFEDINITEDSTEKYIKTIKHIKKMDWHVPFDDESINKIISLVNPEYIVFEFLTDNYEILDSYMNIQNDAINR